MPSIIRMLSGQTSLTQVLALLQTNTGFLEGIVRGYKAGLLTQGQYSNLTQCETLDGSFGLSLFQKNRDHFSKQMR